MDVDTRPAEPEELIAAVTSFRVQCLRQPDAYRGIRIPEALRHDPDHRARDVIQCHAAADDRRLSSELLPQSVAEDGHRLGALNSIADTWTTAEQGTCAERVE